MAENANQLLIETHKGESQFAYFLMGITASAIAFGIHETKDLALHDAPWPIGVAVLLWALSFAAGCFGIDAKHFALRSNAVFLQFFGQYARPGNMGHKLVEDAHKEVEANLARPMRRFSLQKWSLFLGAIFYIAGHALLMSHNPSAEDRALANPSDAAAISKS